MTQAISDSDFGWAAGILDGEGCVSIVRRTTVNERYLHYYYRRLIVPNTAWVMLARLRYLFGGTVNVRSLRPVAKRKVVWVWDLSGPQMVKALRCLEPYLIVKRAQAQIVLYFPAGPPSKHYSWIQAFSQAICYLALRRLNVRGSVER